MYRTLPKRYVLGVFLTTRCVSDVHFTWRRVLLTPLISFYRYNAFGCIYILLTLKNKTKIYIYQLLYFGDMFLNGISLNFCRNPRNVHFDLNSVFISLSCKISFANLWSLFIERIASQFLYKPSFWLANSGQYFHLCSGDFECLEALITLPTITPGTSSHACGYIIVVWSSVW